MSNCKLTPEEAVPLRNSLVKATASFYAQNTSL